MTQQKIQKNRPVVKFFKNIGGAIGDYFATTDKWLILFCLMASGLSLLFLFAMAQTGLTWNSRVVTQAAASGVGVLCALVVSLIDYRTLVKFWKLYVPLCIAGMALTYVMGTVRGANKAWLEISAFGMSTSIQPAEFLKLSFITTFALHLSYVKERMNRPLNMLLLLLHGGAHLLLIALQGDDGTAIVFAAIMVIMLFFAGINWKYMVAGVVALIPGIPFVWYKVMSEYQRMRFLVVWDPSLSEADAYQQTRGLLALGVGGLEGTGLFYDKHIYVPEVYNDFIFAFIGEAAGFIGCMGVILLLLAICFKVLYNSSRAVNDLGRNICVGVFGMLIAQTVINLGMCLRVMPVIGVTLPFISAGGTSVLSLYLAIGLVLSVYRHSEQGFFTNRQL